MNIDKHFVSVQEKIKQAEHRKILTENRNNINKQKIDDRRKFLFGELFVKHFPVALEFVPGKSQAEDAAQIEAFDKFIEALSQCQKCYQELEEKMAEAIQ